MNEMLVNEILLADSIVNACGAVGLAATLATLRRRDPRGAGTRTINAALLVVIGLLATRAAAWWSGSFLFESLSVAIAALLPLGALLITESFLRRHAPRALKAAAAGAAVLLMLGALAGFAASPVLAGLLAAAQVLAFAGCAWLIMTRDKASLTPPENAALDRLAVAAIAIVPFLLTDFRSLVPDVPVRLGGFAALLAGFLMLHNAGGAENWRQTAALLAARLAGGAALGLALAAMAGERDAAACLRFAVVATAGVFAIAMAVEVLRQGFERSSPDVLSALATTAGGARADVLAQLRAHPVFAAARELPPEALVPFDPEMLTGFLAAHPVLRLTDAPWGRPATDPAVERARSLLLTHEATHLLVLEPAPLRLVSLSLPPAAADPAAETAIALARRILAAAHREPAPGPAP
jgi:MFS family permease